MSQAQKLYKESSRTIAIAYFKESYKRGLVVYLYRYTGTVPLGTDYRYDCTKKKVITVLYIFLTICNCKKYPCGDASTKRTLSKIVFKFLSGIILLVTLMNK